MSTVNALQKKERFFGRLFSQGVQLKSVYCKQLDSQLSHLLRIANEVFLVKNQEEAKCQSGFSGRECCWQELGDVTKVPEVFNNPIIVLVINVTILINVTIPVIFIT